MKKKTMWKNVAMAFAAFGLTLVIGATAVEAHPGRHCGNTKTDCVSQGTNYTRQKAHGCGFLDANGDEICDNCGYIDANGDGICDNCGFVDANGDGICDNCGFVDANGDGICDNFGTKANCRKTTNRKSSVDCGNGRRNCSSKNGRRHCR